MDPVVVDLETGDLRSDPEVGEPHHLLRAVPETEDLRTVGPDPPAAPVHQDAMSGADHVHGLLDITDIMIAQATEITDEDTDQIGLRVITDLRVLRQHTGILMIQRPRDILHHGQEGRHPSLLHPHQIRRVENTILLMVERGEQCLRQEREIHLMGEILNLKPGTVTILIGETEVHPQKMFGRHSIQDRAQEEGSRDTMRTEDTIDFLHRQIGRNLHLNEDIRVPDIRDLTTSQRPMVRLQGLSEDSIQEWILNSMMPKLILTNLKRFARTVDWVKDVDACSIIRTNT